MQQDRTSKNKLQEQKMLEEDNYLAKWQEHLETSRKYIPGGKVGTPSNVTAVAAVAPDIELCWEGSKNCGAGGRGFPKPGLAPKVSR